MKELADAILQRLMLPSTLLPFRRSADLNAAWTNLKPIAHHAIEDVIAYLGNPGHNSLHSTVGVFYDSLCGECVTRVTKTLYQSHHNRRVLCEISPLLIPMIKVYKHGEPEEKLEEFFKQLGGTVMISSEINAVMSCFREFNHAVFPDELNNSLLLRSGKFIDLDVWTQPYLPSNVIVHIPFDISEIEVRFDYEITSNGIVFKIAQRAPEGGCTLYAAKVDQW